MRYRHYKTGYIYELVCECQFQPESSITLVVFKANDNRIYATHKFMFEEYVSHNGYMVRKYEPIID